MFDRSDNNGLSWSFQYSVECRLNTRIDVHCHSQDDLRFAIHECETSDCDAR
jgi:hypothetical protein